MLMKINSLHLEEVGLGLRDGNLLDPAGNSGFFKARQELSEGSLLGPRPTMF